MCAGPFKPKTPEIIVPEPIPETPPTVSNATTQEMHLNKHLLLHK